MKTLLLIDANSLIHRAYHALPPLTAPDGRPVGAVYGLSSMLLKILGEERFDYAAAAFDTPEATFREGLFKDYKAHRPKTDEELVGQLTEAHNLFRKFGILSYEKAGYEADDVIATLVGRFGGEKNLKVMVLTGDLDTLQLVRDDKVVVKTPKKGVSETIIYNETAVKERYGLKPIQLTDYKGLVGDPSDNVPGVSGVGPKTASKLIQKYGDLEGLYQNLKKAESKIEEKILKNKEGAFFSRELVKLRADVPLEVSLGDLVLDSFKNGELTEYFGELGFQSLVKRFGKPAEKTTALAGRRKKKGIVLVTGAEDATANAERLSSNKIKIAFDWKPILKELKKKNIAPAPPLFDLKIAGWLLDPEEKDLTVQALSEKFLGKIVAGEQGTLAELYDVLNVKLEEDGLRKIFEEIEMPLIEVIAAMEEWGIGVNIEILKSLDEELGEELEELAKKIYRAAGMVFNINSSQQVGNVLFDKLGIGGFETKTMTGRRSTSQEVLSEMKDKHPIINLILDYRETFKIQSTFVKPLIEAAAGNDRVHTTFLQTGTATGRLASEKPNLQNLPQESKWSGKLRSAFEARPGASFLGFDYSQLELRLLTHISGDKKLRAAFAEGVDAHRLTAAQVFNVPLEKVTPAMRRLGKTLNFGVVYGMGPRAFSGVAGITLEKAKEFIAEYFDDFPGVKEWQDKIKSDVRVLGFVKNENGRRRWLSGRPDEIERAAINMPVQSLGADILKLAMIKTFRVLKENGWLDEEVRPLLTIHDELLFEVDDDILKSASVLLKETVENAYEISVPLEAEVKTGKNLGELDAK